MSNKLSGAEELRAVVCWIDYHNETFLDRFTPEQLLDLWRYGQAHPADVPEMADTWNEADIQAALNGSRVNRMSKPVGKPMQPCDIAGRKKTTIPGAVFDAFNELIAADYTNGRATVRQDGVVILILQKFSSDTSVTRATIFDRGWLNVEDAYRAEGWSVSYDKPAYNESYPATFTFRKR